jgi:prepilin peptidase CpaA
MHIATLGLLCVLAALLIVAAATDIRSRIISNRLNLTIAVLAVPFWIAAGLSGQAMLLQVGVAVAVLLVFGCCFALGMMGGGDVKLLAALALWLPLGTMAAMLVWMALAGGVLTIGMVAFHKLRRNPGQPEIPYGVAIVASAMLFVTNDILTIAAA